MGQPVPGGRMKAQDLDTLLAPMTVERFLERHWERKPLRLARGDTAFYETLPGTDDFEFLLSSLTGPQAGWFSLVKEAARRPSDGFLTAEGLLNLSKVFGAYRDGHSLLLNQVQKRHRETGVLCRAIEMGLSAHGVALSRHIGANGYLSPPRSQGFAIHYDPHDVFILQLEGRKHWRLYRRHVAFPTTPPVSSVPPEVAGPPRSEFVLAPGDFLYIPRGVLHDAYTGDEASLHLTLSLEAVTWRDLFTEVLANDARFRRALPVGFLRNGGPGLSGRRALAHLAGSMASSPAVNDALATVAGRLVANLDPLPNDGFRRIEESASIGSGTWVELGHGTLARVEVTRETAVLHLPGARFSAHRRMARAFRYMLRSRPFRARDLPVHAPPRAKLRLVRELVCGGYLIRHAPPSG
jgi:bifunctional lysine-specific demethylase and histidyl-hydroxylase MINA